MDGPRDTTTRVEISYAYGHKSIEISCKSREISEKWKSEIKLPCARRFSAPYSSVDCSKLQGRPCCGARTRVPAGRPHPRETEKSLKIHRNLEISRNHAEIGNGGTGNQLAFRNLVRHNGPCRTPRDGHIRSSGGKKPAHHSPTSWPSTN